MSTNYPGTITTFVDPAGTAKLSNPDHTQRHIDEADTIEAIQTVMGTTAGTSVLKNFAVGDFPARINATNVLQQAVSGTINNATMGTPAITGGTINTVTMGTPSVTAPKINENVALTSTSTNLNLLSGLSALPTLQSKVITSTRDMTAASGTVAYTGVGFVPTSIMAFGVIQSSYSFGLGFVDSARTEQGLFQFGTNTLYTDPALLSIATSAGVQQYCTVSSYDADGFSLVWTKQGSPTGTAELRFICYR